MHAGWSWSAKFPQAHEIVASRLKGESSRLEACMISCSNRETWSKEVGHLMIKITKERHVAFLSDYDKKKKDVRMFCLYSREIFELENVLSNLMSQMKSGTIVIICITIQIYAIIFLYFQTNGDIVLKKFKSLILNEFICFNEFLGQFIETMLIEECRGCDCLCNVFRLVTITLYFR